MARQVTKATENRYCKARLEAAKWNKKLLTRAGAADVLPGITEDSLKKYELDIVRPPNDAVAIMAEGYNSPELVLWYCSCECPLGKRCRAVPEMPPERTFIRLTNTMNRLTDAMKVLAEIMDGGIDAANIKTVSALCDEFLEARRRIDETMTILEKIERRKS